MPAPAANSRTPRIASQSPEPVRRKGLIDLPGGPEMAPRPPALGPAPAEPWRASGTRPPALGRAPAEPGRASGTRNVSSCPLLGVHPVDRERPVEQVRQHVDPQHVLPVRQRPA